MNFFENYYNNVIKYELLNKFNYKNINKIPKIKKIVLNFNDKNSNFKQIISSLICIELISFQKGIVMPSKTSNIMLKIRKGNPIGCKVILRKKNMYQFLNRLIFEILPNLKQFNVFKKKYLKKNKNMFSFKLSKKLFVSELENFYQFFSYLPYLQITIVTNTVSYKELLFLLKSFQFPIK